MKRLDQNSPILRDDRRPLYRQVYEYLRNEIVSGQRPPGDKLPNEGELAAQMGVSAITSRRALRDLAAEGFIERTPGRGSIVQRVPFSAALNARLDRFLETVLLPNWNADCRVEEFGFVVPPIEVRKALGAGPRDVYQRAVTIMARQGEAINYVITYLPEALGRHYSKRDIQERPRLVLLLEQGVEITRGQQTVGSCPAPKRVADALGLEVGSPMTKLTRLVFDTNGRAVQYLIIYAPWDRHEYRMILE